VKYLICLFGFLCLFSSNVEAAFLPPASVTQDMVSSAQKLATGVGVGILKQGGNAIDAAVAVGYALAVVQPCCGNLGGGGFMLIHRANGKNVFVDFREKAPAAISAHYFFDKNNKLKANALSGYMPVGVPGTVMGLNAALAKYGTMPLKTVIAPAIALAKHGFVLRKDDLLSLNKKYNKLAKHKNVAAIFLNHGKPYQANERLKQTQLAKTLTLIRDQGDRQFYHGIIAKKIVAASKAHHGVLSLADFSNYTVKITKPITCQYRGNTVITVPPPGSGVVVCEILNIVSGYPLSFHSAEATHYNVEAMRYAYADRNQYLGDPEFVKNPLQKLLSMSYAKKIRSSIKPFQAGNSKHMGLQFNNTREKPQTTHYNVTDNHGNAVSVTTTLNGYFGSGVIAGNTGFFLNNELNDFALRAGVPNMFKLVQGKANLIAPNKRPLSSMSPMIVMKGHQPYIILGAAGGSTIITQVVEAIENAVDFGMDINAAVNAPRYHMQWLPDVIYMEPFAFSKDTRDILQSMGYTLQLGSPYHTKVWGQTAAILIDPNTGVMYGATDNRHPGGEAGGNSK
jgi:gamma-glutamyltranspeptidase/glutathione hydrolase